MSRTRRQALATSRKLFAASGLETAGLDARVLLCHACALTHEQLVLCDEALLSPDEDTRFDEMCQRRLTREPIAHLTGLKEFFDLDFAVGPAVLIPRPDTEVLVEQALDFARPRQEALRVLDLGTGSGAILLAILSNLPKASGLGVDYSSAALEIARDNALRLGLANRTSFVQGDWAEAVTGSFDLIVTNPPYIRAGDMPGLEPDVRDFEPEAALIGGEDGLDPLRQIAKDLPRLLAPEGLFLVETAYDQTEQAALILRNVGLKPDKPVSDLNGLPRCVAAKP